jgi:hypothetical protein
MDLSKIFTRANMGAPIPRVDVPGTTEEDREAGRALRAHGDYLIRQRTGFLRAMLATGKPIAARPVPARKRRTLTKNERHMARRETRVAYLKERAA